MSRIKYVTILFWSLLISGSLQSQQNDPNHLKGVVYGKNPEKTKKPLFGASVFWMGTQIGGTTSVKGIFEIDLANNSKTLIVQSIGYESDTLIIEDFNKDISVTLVAKSNTLSVVEVEGESNSTERSFIDPINMQKMGVKELQKAACCNLSESFETNPSVDVSFSDAVTGTRQIQMLGLDGVYVQISRENMPDVRGLASNHGLTFIPGTWIESVGLSKGAGSVINGYESIAGQIDVQLLRPSSMDKAYLNAYVNQMGRVEGNAHLRLLNKEPWSSALLLHAKSNRIKNDNNHDGFMDNPLTDTYIALNRWEYQKEGTHIELGLKGTFNQQQGGETAFDPAQDKGGATVWGFSQNIKRVEAWNKTGKVFLSDPGRSMGLQLSTVLHDQQSYFGLNTYNASQRYLYANLIFQDIINTSDHTIKFGTSFQYDSYHEGLNNNLYERTEIVPGLYSEYHFSRGYKFNLVAGLRADYHNLFGAFFTPRLHLRYAFDDKTVLRVSGGRGQRVANVFLENIAFLATSRQIILLKGDTSLPYGLSPEVAWNVGLNFSRDFMIDYRDGMISIDLYRTEFQNQIVIDRDLNPQEVWIYNLQGSSFSNSVQVQIDYEILKRVDLRLAYRRYDVKTNYLTGLLQKPLIALNRAFANIAYETRNDWSFDLTVNWQGRKRIPSLLSNPEQYQRDAYSPNFVLLNAQISKKWNDKFSAYLGVENITNYRQLDPIIAANDPFGSYFDSSLIWGPIFGRNIYLGLRLYFN